VRRYNARRVKIHRSYTVEEVARLFEVHKNTVRAWLKSGLQQIDDRRPTLLLGRQLASFLHARREHKRQRCRPEELYCFRCRAPRTSAAQRADYLPITASSGNLRAICSVCGTHMYRRISWRKLATEVGDLQVALPQAQQRLVEGADPCLNCDLEQVPDAQPGK
jgi:transposase-like protein